MKAIREKVWAARVRLAYAALVAVFLALVAQFYLPGLGFTSLLSIGSRSDERSVPRLQGVPHATIEDSWGYDGTYYVQLALHPLLDEPERLNAAVDNLSYRARRILPSWVAWGLGLGQPEWIVQAFALLNVAVWLALGWLLLRWLPPDSWGNLMRWGGVLFAHGMCMSVRNSLADAPGLLLIAVMVAAVERGKKPTAALALGAALLTKETSLLAGTALIPPRGSGLRVWCRAAGWAALAAVPFGVWLAYVRWQAGPSNDAGLGNFSVPLSGLAEKCGVVLGEFAAGLRGPEQIASLLVLVALVTQAAFLLLHREPGKAWWRIGVVFAVLMACVAQPVWEGYPGAASRVLLPMTLAFNLLVPRGRRWLAVLVLGNLSAIAGVNEFGAVPHESFTVRGERAVRSQVRLVHGSGWYVAESDGRREWRWSEGTGRHRLVNRSAEPVAVRLTGEAAALRPARLTIRIAGGEGWSGAVDTRRAAFATTTAIIAAGAAADVEFVLDRPGERFANGDARLLAFAIYDAAIAVARAGVAAEPAGEKSK